jgi:SAM-dependent methyltransferase
MYPTQMQDLTGKLPSERTAPGIQIRITDPELQAYLQRYPFATGPDETINRYVASIIAENIFFREAGTPAETRLLSPDETRLPTPEQGRVQELFAKVGMSAADQRVHINDFEWEANLVPRDAKNVLVIGCGDGIELLFLRAVLPEAQITAIDYHDSLLPGILDAAEVTLLVGDMHVHLRTLLPVYDLIFSNHTLEHLYDPDLTLAVLASLLKSGGHMLSVLPMNGQTGSPYLERVHRLVEQRSSTVARRIPMLDFVYLDFGHPWKTNPADISATLLRAGFEDIDIFQRRDHLCRPTEASRAELKRKRKFAVFLNTAIFGPIHFVAKTLFPGGAPLRLRSLIFAIERRLPFGANRSSNAFTEEALFVCRRP